MDKQDKIGLIINIVLWFIICPLIAYYI